MDTLKLEFQEFFSNPKKRGLIIALFGIMAIVALSAGLFLISSTSEVTNLSEEKKSEIIDEIIKNNSSNILEESITNQTRTFTPPTTSLSPAITAPSAEPDLTKYNYRVSTYTYERGPAYNICSIGSGGGYYIYNLENENNYTRTTKEYFEKNKNITRTNLQLNNSNLYSDTLSEYSNIKSDSYEYRGGKYAIHAQFEAYPGYTNPEFLDIPASYTNYYTDNSYYKFLGNETINGKNLYKIQTTYTQFCNGGAYSLIVPREIDSDRAVTIINIMYADAQTFNITKTQSYLKSISNDNLIYTTDNSTVIKLVEFKDVSKEFKFEYSVPVKMLNYSDYWNSFSDSSLTARAKSYLSATNISLMVAEDYIMSSVNVPDSTPKIQGSEYYTDRDFYPTGSEADKYFNKLMSYQDILSAEINQNFYISGDYLGYGYKNISISTYRLGVTTQEVEEFNAGNKYTNKQVSDTIIMIDEQEVYAKKINLTYSYYTLVASYPGDVNPRVISYPTDSWVNTFYIFDFNGRVYLINTKVDIDTINLTSYSSVNPFELNVFFDQKQTYNSYPASYTNVSYPIN